MKKHNSFEVMISLLVCLFVLRGLICIQIVKKTLVDIRD